MKFIMVMIICFGVDCQAVYDSEFEYETYDDCITEAVGVTQYMQLLFPASAGEIHCWDRETFSSFEKYLDIVNYYNWVLLVERAQSRNP